MSNGSTSKTELEQQLEEQKLHLDDLLKELDAERRRPHPAAQRTELDDYYLQLENARNRLALASLAQQIAALEAMQTGLDGLSDRIGGSVDDLKKIARRVKQVATVLGMIAQVAAKVAAGA